MTIEPKLLLPGSTVRIDAVLEGDGPVASAIRQSMTPSGIGSFIPGIGELTNIRDESDSATTRVRASRTVDVPPFFESDGSTERDSYGALALGGADYFIVRTYSFSAHPLPASLEQQIQAARGKPFSQQIESALLTGIRYEWTARLPGSIQSTNGSTRPDGSLIWPVDLASKDDRAIYADSIYVDWPRVSVLACVIAGAWFIVVRRRRSA